MCRIRFRRSRVAVSRLAVGIFVALVVGVSGGGPDDRAVAGEVNNASDPSLPLAVVNVAGVERLLHDVDYLFETAGRPDLYEVVAEVLKNAGDLKGMDREKPFGMMVFLGPGVVPQPAPVGFLPVTDIDGLMETLSVGRVTARPIADEEGRYELVSPRRTLQVCVQGKYAFIANDEEVLDREFPDPVPLMRQLSNRYDLAASVDLDNVPEGIKTLFLNVLQASAEAELQQRDNESDSRYQVRKSAGLRNLQLIEDLLTEGRQLTLGWDMSPERRTAVLELTIQANPDSRLVDYLRDIGGKPSHFSGLLDDTAPMSASVSWMLDDSEQEIASQLLQSAETELARRLTHAQPGEEANETQMEVSVRRLFAPLVATADRGHVDFFVQFMGEPAGDLVLVGGLQIAGGDAFGRALADIFHSFHDHPGLAELTLNADVHRNVAFHRIEGQNVRRQDERIYGRNPGLYIGAGSGAAWFAVGGGQALPALKTAMDKAAETAAVPAGPGSHAPFRFHVNPASWLGKMEPAAEAPRPGRELAREAFSQGNDMLRIDFRPTDDGARLRVQLDEGFIRLLGLGLVRRYDRNR